ncbi:hypothetical protein Tco_1012262 [Tanacetum coccineum]
MFNHYRVREGRLVRLAWFGGVANIGNRRVFLRSLEEGLNKILVNKKKKKSGEDEESKRCCGLNNGRDEERWKSMALREKGVRSEIFQLTLTLFGAHLDIGFDALKLHFGLTSRPHGSTSTPYDLVFPAMGPSLGTTQPTATITSTEDLQRATFTTPPQTAPGTNTTEPPPLPIRNKGPELGADNLTLERVATELAPSDFVSQNYETLVALMQEETKKRSSQSLQARLNFGPENEASPTYAPPKGRRGKDNRRTHILAESETASFSRDVHSRLGQRRSPSESPPSSDSEDSRRKRRRRVSSSSEDTSDNEDAETDKTGNPKNK